MIDSTKVLGENTEPYNEGILVPTHGREPQLIEGIVTLGRDPTNDIVVFDPHVSLFHCQLEKRPKGFFIKDLKSRNGLYLNNARVLEAQLSSGSQIRIGKLEYTFRIRQPGISPEIPISSKNKDWNEQIQRLPHISQTQLPVFLRGESGSGKEIVARIIHDLSPRAEGPFIAVNCSALAESLAESELFGHVKGSFTGASGDRRGAFEAARGGTLFLDEIGDLPISLQPKLLRALEQGEIKPVGSDRTVKTDVRIISATHKDPRLLVLQKAFREDLYFRINVVHFPIPPLRKRIEDFDDLLYLFAREFKVSFKVEAIEILRRHRWSGNIRELKNTVARAKALFNEAPISVENVDELLENRQVAIPKMTRTGMLSGPVQQSPDLQDLERDKIISALQACRGNQRQASQRLGVPKSTLHDRIKFYKINPKLFLDVERFVEDTTNTSLS